jgi:hypothetical protein
MRSFVLAFISLGAALLVACVSTRAEPSVGDPANSQTETVALPSVGAALAAGFEPLPAANPADRATEDHATHQHASTATPQGDATEYTCPMHPEIVRDAPGKCPICGMDLVPKKPKAKQKATP